MISNVYIHSSAYVLGHENQAFTLPDLKTLLPANSLRRMSRLIKASIFVGNQAVQNAGIQEINGILTATGLGCLEDTVKFLNLSLETEDGVLPPTSFIHSTHNSIAGQLALFFTCQGWNNTFSQRYISWESSLLETCLLLQQTDEKKYYLNLAADELLTDLIPVLKKLSCFSKDTLGEGVVAWVLSNEKKSGSIQLLDLKIHKNSSNQHSLKIDQYLSDFQLSKSDIRFFISNQKNKEFSTQQVENQWDIGNYFTNSAAYMELANHLLREEKSGYALIDLIQADTHSTVLMSYVQ